MSAQKQEIERLINICRKNKWSTSDIKPTDNNDVVLSKLRSIVAYKTQGKRMREDGVYF